MIVRNYMTSKVVTLNKQASIQEALRLMKQHSIRHLPVTGDDMELEGWVTDADLRGVLLASMLETLSLEDVMIRNPYTVTPGTHLSKAAQLMLEKRIGGLPVLENDRLIGVITVIDILSAFIPFMDVLSRSEQWDVTITVPKQSAKE